jgi:P4 family phage/plasmid primase-like protien
VDRYEQWIQVGMALKNSGHSCELWDEWSRTSSKYKTGVCHEKWRSFTETDRPLTKSSLYAWLKEDNYELFIALQGNKDHIQNSLFLGTNASIADAFYEMNPYRYVFSSVDGWYVLQPNHTWLFTGSTDVMSICNILNTIRDECKHLLTEILIKCNKNKEDDGMIHKRLGDTLKKISTSSFLKGVAAFLAGLYMKTGVEKRFNEKRNLFAFTNGVIDMETHQFREIEPDDYITVTCGYDYREPAVEEKTMVRGFLQKIFPVGSVLDYVILALSRTFVGVNSEQLFHVFTGMGANGKSCLMDLCKIVFGEYYQTFSVSYLTKENDGKDKPLPEFAAARYARMLVTSEPDDRDRFQINVIKNITGNEEVGFRGMYAKQVTRYIPQYKIWILTNDMPKLSKYDQAIERRMRCVHFPTRFVYEPRGDHEALRDDTLSEQFKCNEGWKFGLLGLLLDAARFTKEKLTMPDEVRECTDAYMLENNPVGAWLRQHYDMTGRRDDVVQKTELYQAFGTDTGVHKTQKAFSDDMVKCNVQARKSDGIWYYYGIIRR